MAIIIIPARFGSKRLPGKPLINIAGYPLIVHVLNQARQIKKAEAIWVATDDKKIAEVVENEGGKAVISPRDLKSGSDRVGWVVRNVKADIVVNLQGDEPLVDIDAVDNAIELLERHDSISVATLGKPLIEESEWRDLNVVKLITDSQNTALYFSRSPIPHFRNEEFRPLPCLFKHIGIYVFRRTFLLNYVKWESSLLEKAEKLEQLRIIERGYKIHVIESNCLTLGIDTIEDVKRFEGLLKCED